MYEFKIGDKVRIRDDIGTIENEPPSINREMREMGGRVCTIQSAGQTRCTLNEIQFIWLYKWLEPYEEETDIEIAVQDLDGIL